MEMANDVDALLTKYTKLLQNLNNQFDILEGERVMDDDPDNRRLLKNNLDHVQVAQFYVQQMIDDLREILDN